MASVISVEVIDPRSTCRAIRSPASKNGYQGRAAGDAGKMSERRGPIQQRRHQEPAVLHAYTTKVLTNLTAGPNRVISVSEWWKPCAS